MYHALMYRNHSDIIGAWASVRDFADDIGVPLPTAKAMKQRASIRGCYWNAVTEAAKRRRIKGINQSVLAQLAPMKRGRVCPVSTLHVA